MRSALLLTLLLAAPSFGQTADPRVAFIERAAWNALDSGQAKTAAELFRQAISSDPGNAQLHVGAAAAAYADRRDDDARTELDRALSLDPKLPAARQLLGRVLHREGDLPGAIRVYESLATDRAADRATRETIARWKREFDLQLRMQQTYGDHFAVSFEGPAEEALAVKVIASLSRAFDRVCGVLNTYPTRTISVVLYTSEQFVDITRAPGWAAAAYDGTIRVPMRGALDDDAELDRVLAHEFTHALVRTIAPSTIPTWLNEGVATALESTDLQWARRTVADAPAVTLDLLTRSFERLSGGQAQLAYATSAVAVQHMLDEAGGVAVANLIRDLGNGVDFDVAFERRIQRRFDQFQASLRE